MSNKWRWKILGAVLATVLLAATGWAQEERGPGGPEGMPGSKGVMGMVTAVDANGFTVKTQDGEAWKVMAGPNTRVMHERDPAKLADVKPGYGVMAMGQADATAPNTLHAAFAVYQTAEEVKARMADFGRTWIGGKVTVVEGTKITVTVQQPGQTAASSKTFEVDETTDFKKGRDEATLADVKPGDYVMGRGGIKGGVFVPTTLTIRTPGEHRRGPGGPGGAPGEAGPDGPPPAGPPSPAPAPEPPH
jgi:preprotein translocase subunit YajC